MDPEIAHSFLKYDKDYQQLRQNFLQPLALPELKKISTKHMEL